MLLLIEDEIALPLAFDDRQNVAFRHDQVLLIVQLHLGSSVFPVKHQVASLDRRLYPLARVVDLSITHGHDFAPLGLFLRSVRDDNAPLTCSPSSNGLTKTRSPSGFTLLAIFMPSYILCLNGDGQMCNTLDRDLALNGIEC